MIEKRVHIEVFDSNGNQVDLTNLDDIKKHKEDYYQIAIQDLDHQLERNCLRDYEITWVYFSHEALFSDWENEMESAYSFEGNLSEIAENLYKYANNGVKFDLTQDEWDKYNMDKDEYEYSDLEKIKNKIFLID